MSMVAASRRIWCCTLGCDKNLVDSERLLARCAANGFVPTADPERAGVWLLNTCSFIAAARRDSESALRKLADAKGDRLLAVVGCWAQEAGEELRQRHPAVDVIGGIGRLDELMAALAERAGTAVVPAGDGAGRTRRQRLTPAHVAFVKIGDGCNRRCTFCRIPQIRGPLRSRPATEIEREVRTLVADGVTEVQLVSQNTSDFGRDTGEDLLSLVRRLDGIDGLRRIRLLYLYGGVMPVGDVLRLLELERVVPYLDVPIQHASPRILRAMRRPGDPQATARFFDRLRRERPDVVLRTTALVGFPGEEEEDVEQLLDFMARVEFDHLGTYRYSAEAGTEAAALVTRASDEEVADREARVVDLQATVAQQRMARRLGERHEIVVDTVASAGGSDDATAPLVEGLLNATWSDDRERARLARVHAQQEPVAVARSYHFGYDLDGGVVLPAEGRTPGEWLAVRFLAATPYDVWAAPAAEPIGRRRGD
jgi:ribosomal protein S12 methylthiotransferase